MEKSIKKSFSYMFKEEGWTSKAGYIFILCLIIWIILCFLIANIIFLAVNHINPKSFILQDYITLFTPIIFFILFGLPISYFISGYFAKCTQNVINYKPGIPVLPERKNNLLNGYILGAKKIGAIRAIQVLIQPLNICLGIPTLILMILKPALNRNFCTEFKFNSYLQWEKATELIGKNGWLYTAILLWETLFGILTLTLIIMLFFLKINFAIIAIVLALYITYIAFVTAYMEALVGEPKKVKE